jgi:hypothetical protein
MPIKSYFYDSNAGDRVYSASDFADAFSIAFLTGVIPEQNGSLGLAIGGTNFTTISSGKAFVDGRFVEVEGTETLTVPTGSYAGQVVLKIDKTGTRDASLLVKTHRTPQQNQDVWEYPLYNVTVTNNVITAIASDLRAAGGAGTTGVSAHVADFVKHPAAATTTNSGNNYAVTLSPAPTAYVDQMGIVLKINADSTGAATINVNGLGAKPLTGTTGTAITDLKTNGIYTFRYNATTGNFIVQGEGGVSGQVLSDLIVDINSILGM